MRQVIYLLELGKSIYHSGQGRHCKEAVKRIIMRSARVERERRTSTPFTRHPQMV